ncbi:MAG: FkbM family methyltransferase [Acidobacteriota bacterium]
MDRTATGTLPPSLGFGHRLHLAALRLWRGFPWPGGRGRYFFKRLVLGGARGQGPRPIPTDVGWLWLEWGEDVLQATLYANGRHYEDEVTDYLVDLDLEGACVLDVGAHAGFYAVLLARKIGPTGRLVAFEPQATLAASVRRSLGAAGAEWATVEERAVGAEDGVLTLHLSADSGRTTAGRLPDGELETAEVPVVRLDRFIAGRLDGPPTLIKIDIEGAEWLAVDGLGDLLDAPDAPSLVIEIHPRQIVDLGGSQDQLVERLRGHGYEISRLHHRTGLGPLEEPLPTTTTWHLLAEKRARRGQR